MKVILLTAPDCHLCGHARDTLDRLGADWRELPADSAEAERLVQAAPPLRPLLFTEDGELLAYGRLSERRLRKQLEREAVGG